MQPPVLETPEFPELGFYGLAGHTENPRDLLTEVIEAEQLGLGAVFLSERFNYKDAAVMAGGAKAPHRGMRGARPGIGPAPSAPLTPEPTNHARTRSGRRGAAMRPLRSPGPRSAAPVGAKTMT